MATTRCHGVGGAAPATAVADKTASKGVIGRACSANTIAAHPRTKAATRRGDAE